MKRRIKMHFESLHCVNLQSNNSRDVQVNWISFVFAQSQKAYIFLKLKDMEWFISMFGTLSNNFPLCIFFVHLLIDKAEKVPLVTFE